MAGDDPLVEALGSVARHVRRVLRNERNLTIERDSTAWTGGGYTDAFLAAVTVAPFEGVYREPTRYLAKVSPRKGGRAEAARHNAAVLSSYREEFARDHLVSGDELAPITWRRTVVSFQRIAGGSLHGLRAIGKLDLPDLAETCRVVRAALLEAWTGRLFGTPRLTVPALLRTELGKGVDDWSATTEYAALPADQAPPPPNLLLGGADDREHTVLFGRSHGDLHADNILVRDQPRDPGRFWLIDLAAFEKDAPLTRDPATLLISILAHRISDTTPDEHESMLGDLAQPWYPGMVSTSGMAAVIDAVRDPGDAPFVAGDWLDSWAEQLQISLLAAALKHSTYDSVGAEGRTWCLRLAANLWKAMFPRGGGAKDVPARHPVHRPKRRKHAALLNQKASQKELRAAVLDPLQTVVVVHGDPGVGKSAVVDAVIADLDGAGPRVVRHDAATFPRPDVMTLVEDLEAGASSGHRCRPGESAPVRLAAAADALPDPVLIVIERADLLLATGAGVFADDDLDDALEKLSTGPARKATVVLVTRRLPTSGRSRTWPFTVRPITIRGLTNSHFRTLLSGMSGSSPGLSDLGRDSFRELRDKLQGNPVAGRVAQAIVSSTDGGHSAETLAAAVKDLPTQDVPRFLANEQILHIPHQAKLVLGAVAAYGIPADLEMISALLTDQLGPGNVVSREHVGNLLPKLAARHLIEAVGTRYRIPTGDPNRLLESPPVDAVVQKAMLMEAAYQIGMRQKMPRDVHDLADAEMYFAEIDVWLRAGEYGAAYELIGTADRLLRRWGQELLLLERRKEIRAKLDDPVDQMSNSTALGDLYATRGKFALARKAFEAAADIADNLGDDANRRRIDLNYAAMHWEAGETDLAEIRYRAAFDRMSEETSSLDRAGALEGLADCHRRWGDYASAVREAECALSVLQQADARRAVEVALKLARWHADTGDVSSARRLVAAAHQDAAEQADEALIAARTEAEADLLLLSPGTVAAALAAADRASAMARRQRNPIIQLQAQTTRCLALLMSGDLGLAAEAIEEADRYRRTERSLVVLALRALVTAARGDNSAAAKLFDSLWEEATARTRDERDVGAQQFVGFARCRAALEDDRALIEAVGHFTAARRRTRPAAPGVEDRLSYLVRRLDACGPTPGRLDPVLAAIRGVDR